MSIRRLIIIFIFAISLLSLPFFALAQAEVTFPELTGEYQIGKVEFHLIDDSRDEVFTDDPEDQRELMVTVHYPAEPAADAQPAPYARGTMGMLLAQSVGLAPDAFEKIPTRAYVNAPIADAELSYPVIIFSPGMGNLPIYYTATLEDLTSNGYIVVSLSHPYSTSITVFPDDRMVFASPAGFPNPAANPEGEFAERNRIGAVWTADVIFVLDELERLNETDALLAGHLDLSRVGVFGHSFGGATAAEATYLDDRFLAAINMDGSFFGGVIENGLTKPFMMMRSEVIPVTDEELEAYGITREYYEQMNAQIGNDSRAVYETSETGYLFTLMGSAHSTYSTDMPLFAPLMPTLLTEREVGTIEATRAVEIINTYVLAFFDKHVKGETVSLLDSASPDYPEVEFETHS